MTETDAAAHGTPAAGSLSFSAGDVAAGRYRIVRFLGAGGMGEVYEADDLLLQKPVALKTLRPAIAASERALARFRREIRLSHRVTHANVCRVFDLGLHGEIAFLTMELLTGETLASRLRQEGPMSEREALPIAVQIAAALDAAHDAGVVHRDLKSSNVLLVGERAVVTDFGIALPRETEESAPPGDEAHAVGATSRSGTTGYMAPEQVAGESPGPTVDIYALGVVLHEMVTGRLPSAPGAGPVPSPRWEAAIRRCLRHAPRERFARAGDVVPALTERRTSRRLLATALAAVLAAFALVVTTRGRDEPAGGTTLPASVGRSVPPVVAVLGFRDLSRREQTAWISTALAELVATELDGPTRVVGPGAVAAIRRNLTLPDGDPDPATLTKLRGALGADFVVSGSYVGGAEGNVIELVLDLHDSRTGERKVRTTILGTETALVGLAGRAARRAHLALGATWEGDETRAVAPSDPRVARMYFEAVDALRGADDARARVLAEQAAALAPDDPLVALVLAQALGSVGTRGEALRAYQRAHAISGSLPAEQRLFIEARLRIHADEWREALVLLRQLFATHPTNVDYAMLLMGLQAKTGDHAGAMATVATARRHVPPEQLVQVDLFEAEDAISRGDLERGASLAEHAAEMAERQGAYGLVADARARAGRARFAAGDLAAARRDSRDARALNRSALGREFNKNPHADLAVALALEEGDPAEALRLARIHATFGEQSGEPRAEVHGLQLAGLVAWEQGDEAAPAVLRRAIDRGDTECPRTCRALAQRTLAEIALDAGRLDEARAEARASVAAFGADAAVPGAVEAVCVLASVELASGRVFDAAEQASRALILAARSRRLDLTWRAEAVAARIAASAGGERAREAAGRLAALAEQARAQGFVYQELRLRVDHAAALELAGDRQAASVARTALSEEARARGFVRLARAVER